MIALNKQISFCSLRSEINQVRAVTNPNCFVQQEEWMTLQCITVQRAYTVNWIHNKCLPLKHNHLHIIFVLFKKVTVVGWMQSQCGFFPTCSFYSRGLFHILSIYLHLTFTQRFLTFDWYLSFFVVKINSSFAAQSFDRFPFFWWTMLNVLLKISVSAILLHQKNIHNQLKQ